MKITEEIAKMIFDWAATHDHEIGLGTDSIGFLQSINDECPSQDRQEQIDNYLYWLKEREKWRISAPGHCT